MYHVLSPNEKLLSVSQLTKIVDIVECWLDRFFVKDLKNDELIVIEGFLNSRDWLYEFCWPILVIS